MEERVWAERGYNERGVEGLDEGAAGKGLGDRQAAEALGEGSGGREATAVSEGLFIVLARRWVVERTLAWISCNRGMSRGYEFLLETTEALVYVARCPD